MRNAASKTDTPTSRSSDSTLMAQVRAAAALPDKDINLTDPDAPHMTDWSGAERGRFYRPVKRLKSLRIDADVLAYFESLGKGYQARINRVLREAMERDAPFHTRP
jgi:uncharacterized protein (DUF4415 family)